MSRQIAIIGAGSIGNHLSFSCRRMKWNTFVFDINKSSLHRMRNDIYPHRYGVFDESIRLEHYDQLKTYPEAFFDVVFIGTPPDSHLSVARDVVQFRPKVVLIEKPAIGPSQEELREMHKLILDFPETVFLCGYNHRVSSIVQIATSTLERLSLDSNISISVLWQESWVGILNAHPWLRDQFDTYLGYSLRGGGALFEHSHGLDIWLYFARLLKLGSVGVEKSLGTFAQDSSGDYQYDESIIVDLLTSNGNRGRVVQDVVSFPAIKTVEVNTSVHRLKVTFGDVTKGDSLLLVEKRTNRELLQVNLFKERSLDFDLEICEIDKILRDLENQKVPETMLSLDSALVTTELATEALKMAIDSSGLFRDAW